MALRPGGGGLYEFLAPLSPTLISPAMGFIIIPYGFNKSNLWRGGGPYALDNLMKKEF